MAGVPIAAEKGATMAKLRARGTAEDKYLSALSSFANLAFQAEEGRLGREQSRLNLQASLQSSERRASMGGGGSSIYIPESERRTYGAGMTSSMSTPAPAATPSINYSQQFPSLYGSGGQLPPAPDWTSGGSNQTWTSGGYTSTSLAGMSGEELQAYYDRYV
jgi:hypothetical protein